MAGSALTVSGIPVLTVFLCLDTYDTSWTDTGIVGNDEFVIVALPFPFIFYGTRIQI